MIIVESDFKQIPSLTDKIQYLAFTSCSVVYPINFLRKKKAYVKVSLLILQGSFYFYNYREFVEFNSLKACSKRATMPTSPARCQTRGS